jgi:predicted HTH transcriptional regulator
MVHEAEMPYYRRPLYGRHPEESARAVVPETPQPVPTVPDLPLGKFTAAYREKLITVYRYLQAHPHTSTEEVASLIQLSRESAKKYLKALVDAGLIVPEGGNKNRRYRAKE